MVKVVVQDDAVLRHLQVVLDPTAAPERRAAFADYFSVDIQDYDGWLGRLQDRMPGLYPASVTLVSDQSELRDQIADADAVVVESLTIGESELELAKNLAIVQKFGIDLRNIDRPACRRRNIVVKPLRRRVNVAVAEHAFALILALAKQICRVDKRIDMKSLQKAGFCPGPFDTRHSGNANWARVPGLATLQGMTLGSIGLGEIGREVAVRAQAFDMDVLYFQRNRLSDEVEASMGARYCALDQLLEKSDVVSVHVPFSADTENLLDRDALARLKPGAFLINVSRARIVNREALMEALESGRLGGAGLDVHYKEPAEENDPLTTFKNVVLTPHTAVANRENGARDIEELTMNLARAVTKDP